MKLSVYKNDQLSILFVAEVIASKVFQIYSVKRLAGIDTGRQRFYKLFDGYESALSAEGWSDDHIFDIEV